MTRAASNKAAPASQISESLRALVVPIDQVQPDPANVRTHSERNIAAIASSLQEFGQRTPLVALRETGRVLKGNGTLDAARRLGWTEIAVVWVAETDERARAYAIADNRSGELAEWDVQGLGLQLRELEGSIDLTRLGWEPHELEPLLRAEWNPPAQRDGADGEARPQPIRVSVGQREVFERAAERARETADDPEMAEGQCLELICAAYLASEGA